MHGRPNTPCDTASTRLRSLANEAVAAVFLKTVFEFGSGVGCVDLGVGHGDDWFEPSGVEVFFEGGVVVLVLGRGRVNKCKSEGKNDQLHFSF